MIEFLQSLLRRVTDVGRITEEEIRNKHSIYIDAWCGSFAPSHLSQRKNLRHIFHRLRHWFKTLGYRVYHAEMRIEMRMAGARAPESKSHIPVAHSSLTMIQGFLKAKALFKSSRYFVYRVAGQAHLVEPLVGRDTIIVFERVTPISLVKQPLRVGDVVTFRQGDKRILYRITRFDKTGRSFCIDDQPVPNSSVEGRLTATIYTQAPDESNVEPEMDETARDRDTLFVTPWDEALFCPTNSDKPTPHSSLKLREKKEKIYAVFRYPDHITSILADTNSMEPFIDANTFVVEERLTEQVLNKQPLQVGDIVTWSTGKRQVLHRIRGIDKDRKSLYIRGDNVAGGDSFRGRLRIPAEHILERVVAVVYTKQHKKGD